MLDKLIFAVPALLVGIGVAVQGVVNAGLARGLGSYILAATISFCVGTVALTAISLATGGISAALQSARDLPVGWWVAGGLLGAAYVVTITFIVPKIGIGAAMAFIITGQLFAAALLDHFGALGLPEQPLSLMRVVGVLLLLAGALLVRFF